MIEHCLCLRVSESDQAKPDRWVLDRQDTGRENRRVDGSSLANGQRPDRHTRRHLHDTQQGIEATEHGVLVADRHPENRQVGLGRAHAW